MTDREPIYYETTAQRPKVVGVGEKAVAVGWISEAHPPSPPLGGCAPLIHPTRARFSSAGVMPHNMTVL